MPDLKLGIGIIAEMKEFEKSLATIPGIGAKEARDMVTGIRRELKNAESAAGTSAKAIGSGFSSEFNKVTSGAAAMASAMGGPFARMASVANSSLKPITEVSGELGVIGGAAVVVAGTAYAMHALADAAQEGAAELAKMGIHLDPHAQSQITAYTQAQSHLSTEIDKVKVSAGSTFAEIFAIVDQAVSTDIQWLAKWADKLGGVTTGVGFLKGQLDALAKAVGIDPQAAQAQADYIAMVQYLGDTVEPKIRDEFLKTLAAKLKLQDADNKGEDIAHDRATADLQRAVAGRAAVLGLADAVARLHAEQLGPTGQIIAQGQQQLTQLANMADAAVKAGGDIAAVNELAGEAGAEIAANTKKALHDLAVENQRTADEGARYLTDLVATTAQAAKEATTAANNALKQQSKDMRKEILSDGEAIAGMLGNVLGDVSSFFDAVAAKDLALGQQERDTAKKSADAWKKGQDEVIEKLYQSGRISAGEHTQRLSEVDQESKARVKAANERSKVELDAARQAFNLSQAAQISQALMATALAEIQAFAQLGPVAGAIAAPILATELGFQLAAIRGQKPPSYPMGGMVDPDHHLVGVQDREAVLNRRAVTELGPDTIRSLNEGRGTGSGHVTVVLDRRILAEAVADAGVAHPRQRTGKRIYRRRHP